MDVTDVTSVPDRQFIQSYGPGRFTISGNQYEGSVLVSPDSVLSWEVAAFEEASVESFEPLLKAAQDLPEILLLGTGVKTLLPSRTFREAMKERGISVEPMHTGAACRTYNVLMIEGRSVSAALIAL